MRLRRTYRISWDDNAPVVVTTNAWDTSAGAEHQANPSLAAVAMVHHALERDGHMVPPLKKFMDVLDEMYVLDKHGNVATRVDDLGNPVEVDVEEEPEEEPDPTLPAPGPTGPLPSRSSPERTGDAGTPPG